MTFAVRTAAIDALRVLLAYGVLPNLVMGLIAVYFGAARPLINLDYLGIAVLAPFLPLWLLRFGIGFAVVLDLMQVAAPTYHFSMAKILETTRDLFNLSPAFAVPIIVGVLLLAASVAWAMTRITSRRRSLHGVYALILAVTALFADMALSPNAITGMDRAVTQLNVAGSPGLLFLVETYASLRGEERIEIAHDQARAAAPLAEALEQPSALPKHIVMVAVESWGLYTDPAVNELIVTPLRRMATERPDLSLQTDAIDFHGSTVNGELRELCGLRSNSIRLPHPAIPLNGCLPERLATLGYETMALHGYRGSMFNRSAWYPLLGFQRSLFDQDLSQALQRSSRCGSTFPGICDGDVPEWIGNQLDQAGERPQFIYWLTLNAHLPIYATQDPRAEVDCASTAVTAGDEQQCRLVKLHHLVMQSLADLLSRRTDTALIVVGDHAPAFVSGTRRHQLSTTQVPSAVLWPRPAPEQASPVNVSADD